MISFTPINLLTASTEEWSLFHQIRHEFQTEEFPDDPLMSDNALEDFRKGNISNQQLVYRYFLIFDDKNLIGSFWFYYYDKNSPSYKGNEKIVIFDISLLRKVRRKGIGSKAFQLIVEQSILANKSVFITESSLFDSKQFFRALGFTIAQTFSEKKLLLATIDTSMLINWITEAENANPETKVIIVEGTIPPEYIDEFAISFTECANDDPRDDVERGDEIFTAEFFRNDASINEKIRTKVFTGLAIEKDAKISGLTQLKMHQGREKILSQNLTGIPKRFLGRNIGKWVKAKAYLYIKDNYPEVQAFITGNANSNGPMAYINEKLGYKIFREVQVAQISLAEAKKYFHSKKS